MYWRRPCIRHFMGQDHVMAYANTLLVAQKARFQLKLELLYHSKDIVICKIKESLSRLSQAVSKADCTTQVYHLVPEMASTWVT